jgi:hypothetical protein
LKKPDIDDIIVKGHELMKHCTGDDILATQDKVDRLKDRYTNLNTRCSDQVSHMEDALPIAEKFKDVQEKYHRWLQHVEPELRGPEPTGTEAEKFVEVSVHLAYLYHSGLCII